MIHFVQGLVGRGWRHAATVMVNSCNTEAGMECLLQCIEDMASRLAGRNALSCLKWMLTRF